MLSEERFEFTKDNIDLYLREVAKEYRKQAGKKMPAELVLIGGASVLVNYGFRNMTTDIDALIRQGRRCPARYPSHWGAGHAPESIP